ncbi:MAG: PAS domain S-box protein [Candidatus Methanoperedens sp.]|nr:PAS domain S-box protein [Candidatus Methanoperedens sp.]
MTLIKDEKAHKERYSVFRMLIFFTVSIFIVEFSIMLLFDFMQSKPIEFFNSFLDGLLLVLIVFPLMYFFIYRPMLLEIKERKKISEVLQQSEERIHNLMQSAYDAIIVVDGKGDIIVWNNGAKIMFGYSEQEALGKPLMMLMPEKFRSAHKNKLDIVTSTGNANLMGKVLELQGLKKDGAEFPIELTLATWEVGKERFYSGIIRDISERKAAQEALIDSEEKFRTLYDSSSDAIMLLDEKGFFDCNNATLQIFGFIDKEDFIKMHPSQVSPPYQPNGFDSLTAANNKIGGGFH